MVAPDSLQKILVLLTHPGFTNLGRCHALHRKLLSRYGYTLVRPQPGP